MDFCDLHTHILPGVDDGAQTIEQSLEMLRNAVASDVTTVVATPHCSIPGTFENFNTPDLLDRFAALQEAAKDIPIRLLLGGEIRVTEQIISLLDAGKLPTINNGRYLLTEFPNDFPAQLFSRVLEQLLDQGVLPLVAHPERYSAVCAEPMIVEKWLKLGCHIQLTGGSILGKLGKAPQKAAKKLLHSGLVCCVASDAHNTTSRSNFLSDVYDHISLHYSRPYANQLMTTNPLAICNNQLL